MPIYYWKFKEYFNNGNYLDVIIEMPASNIILAKKKMISYIIKQSRFGNPKIVLTPKGKTVFTHSNDKRANNMPYADINYLIFQKILCMNPYSALELNHMPIPFITSYKQ